MFRKAALGLLIAIALIVPSGTTLAQENRATIYGTTYDWFTFDPMYNVVVEINTSPVQTMVADNGDFSFEVPFGSYIITAGYYENTLLREYAEENITVTESGSYRIDLILLPTLEDNDFTIDPPDFNIDDGGNALAAASILAGIAILGAIVAYYAMKKKPAEISKQSVKVIGLPKDLQGVMEAIRAEGGRANQVELRRKLPYSEAKVSLMLTDLENRGLIKRIKKGRGNIVISTEGG